MKVLVHFNSKKDREAYEAFRLQKNIKGALNLAGVETVDSLFSSPDIIHLLSPQDEMKARDAKIDGIKVVTSALYAERDFKARFLEEKEENGFRLRSEAERLLHQSDLVLVPDEKAKSFLQKLVPDCDIKVVSPGVNFARFEELDEVECRLFSYYFRLKEGTPYVISMANNYESEVFSCLELLAQLLPKLHFFLLVNSKKGRNNSLFLRKYNRKTPPNIHVHPLLEDDVYRSGLLGAKAFLALGNYGIEHLIVLEANAAHTPVYVLGNQESGIDLIDDEDVLYRPTITSLAESLKKLIDEPNIEFSEKAYKKASNYSLKNIGDILKRYYLYLLEGKEND